MASPRVQDSSQSRYLVDVVCGVPCPLRFFTFRRFSSRRPQQALYHFSTWVGRQVPEVGTARTETGLPTVHTRAPHAHHTLRYDAHTVPAKVPASTRQSYQPTAPRCNSKHCSTAPSTRLQLRRSLALPPHSPPKQAWLDSTPLLRSPAGWLVGCLAVCLPVLLLFHCSALLSHLFLLALSKKPGKSLTTNSSSLFLFLFSLPSLPFSCPPIFVLDTPGAIFSRPLLANPIPYPTRRTHPFVPRFVDVNSYRVLPPLAIKSVVLASSSFVACPTASTLTCRALPSFPRRRRRCPERPSVDSQ